MYVTTHQHITYMLHTGKHPVSHPSIQACTYICMYICTYVCLFVRVYSSHSPILYADVPFGRHILICSLYVYSRPVTKALKIFPANNKLKLANTHNFCYMRINTHTCKQTHAYICMYERTYVCVYLYMKGDA